MFFHKVSYAATRIQIGHFDMLAVDKLFAKYAQIYVYELLRCLMIACVLLLQLQL
jgi:hypothetical protein